MQPRYEMLQLEVRICSVHGQALWCDLPGHQMARGGGLPMQLEVRRAALHLLRCACPPPPSRAQGPTLRIQGACSLAARSQCWSAQ